MRELDLFYDNRKSKVSHYEGRLGVFDYDPEEFELQEFCYEYYLHYCGKGKSVDLPKGCIDTSYMFAECELPPDFTLGPDFDTSNVTNMSRMFLKCILPENFSLGKKFDTSNVTDMEAMFDLCRLPQNFSLGDKFDTSKVTTMNCMFMSCKFPKMFSLGNKFDTSSVVDMQNMISAY